MVTGNRWITTGGIAAVRVQGGDRGSSGWRRCRHDGAIRDMGGRERVDIGRDRKIARNSRHRRRLRRVRCCIFGASRRGVIGALLQKVYSDCQIECSTMIPERTERPNLEGVCGCG